MIPIAGAISDYGLRIGQMPKLRVIIGRPVDVSKPAITMSTDKIDDSLQNLGVLPGLS